MSVVAMRARPSSSRPMCGSPSSTAIVAGTAPAAATAASSSRATSRLRGRGRPWAMIVDSSATTAAAGVERLADRLAERGHYRAAAEQPTDGGDPAADDEAGDGRADQHLLLVLGDLLAPVGDLGHLAAQARRASARARCGWPRSRRGSRSGRAGRHGSERSRSGCEDCDGLLDELRLVDRQLRRRRRAGLAARATRCSRRARRAGTARAATKKKPQKNVLVGERAAYQRQPREAVEQDQTSAEDDEDAGRDPDDRALDELGDLLGDLGLGQLDLLADEQRRAARRPRWIASAIASGRCCRSLLVGLSRPRAA